MRISTEQCSQDQGLNAHLRASRLVLLTDLDLHVAVIVEGERDEVRAAAYRAVFGERLAPPAALVGKDLVLFPRRTRRRTPLQRLEGIERAPTLAVVEEREIGARDAVTVA